MEGKLSSEDGQGKWLNILLKETEQQGVYHRLARYFAIPR
jgi:hypothetical protein